MVFTTCSVATNNISTLDDLPNDVGGLTATQLKAAFDKAPTEIKGYINDTLIPELDGLADALKTHKNDHVSQMVYATADGTDTYAVAKEGITALTEGLSIKAKFTNANTGASTLNINELGAVAIKKSNGGELSAGNIQAGQILHLVYTGSVFQLLGEGGEYGTAQANDVLSGKTIGTENGLVDGAIPDNGVKIITPSAVEQALEGFYASGSKVNGVSLFSAGIKPLIAIREIEPSTFNTMYGTSNYAKTDVLNGGVGFGKVKSSGFGYWYWYVDFTNYNYLVCDAVSGDSYLLLFGADSSLLPANNSSARPEIFALIERNQKNVLDISSLSGMNYVYIGAYNSSYAQQIVINNLFLCV